MALFPSVLAAEPVGQADSPATIGDLETVFSNVISTVLVLGGIVLFVMLVVGGFQFITAGDDPQKAEAAKKTITSAVVGLVLVASAYLFLQLIAGFSLSDPTGLTNFTVSQ